MKTQTCTVLGAALAMTFGAVNTAEAGSILEVGTYQLHNHPDGNAANPLYGLRLDELQDVTDGHDIFTFDFDAPGASMWMDYDGRTVHIYGVAYGGLDTGTEYDPKYSSYVDIDFTYENVTQKPDDDDMWVHRSAPTNYGFISPVADGSLGGVAGGQNVRLVDYAGNHDYTFRLGDGNDDRGHRGFDGISGWGWLNHSMKEGHVASSDWLFTASLVPVPPAVWLGAGGLFFARIASRRVRKARA